MSDKNQQQDPNSKSLQPGEKIPQSTSEGNMGNCDEILKIIQSRGGLPVTINPNRVPGEGFPANEFNEVKGISQFIKESRIHFNIYKSLMDNILNCGLGDIGGGGVFPGGKKVFTGNCPDPGTGDGGGIGLASKSPSGPTSSTVPTGGTGGTTGSAGSGTPGTPTGGTSYSGNPPSSSSPLLTQNENNLFRNGTLFTSSKSYHILKYATEKFVFTTLGVDDGDIRNAPSDVLPYVALIEAQLKDACSNNQINFRPLFSELIWSYWMEEGMLVHTLNAIARRFQNKRSHRGVDPLANLDLDPLRSLNNLIWGYIQDAPNRLTHVRRTFEYDHQYGLSLFAAGGVKPNSADSRSFFIEAFNNLLYRCSIFYKEADNLFKVPDAFPVLNALREVHLLLAEGAGSQFGDLPITARTEMMMEQYILSRPEIREFLGGRIMVPYDEPWMDKVDTMKTLQGWPGASISYFRDLATFGEEIILSIRWISWSQVNNRDVAREWALVFRDAIQRYLHCYQAVTGVDLTALEVAGGVDQKSIMPALLIGRKAQRDLSLRKR